MPQLTSTKPERIHPHASKDGTVVICRCDGVMANDQYVYCAVASAEKPPEASDCAPPNENKGDGVKLAARDRQTPYQVNMATQYRDGLAVWAWLKRDPKGAIVTIDLQFEGVPAGPKTAPLSASPRSHDSKTTLPPPAVGARR